MIEKTISSASIASMMQTLRTHQSQAAGMDVGTDAVNAPGKTDFADAIRQAIGSVNSTQVNSQNMSEAYERGEDVPLTDVVLNMQKASLSFEATLQVRNKVLKAYEDIMNMPV